MAHRLRLRLASVSAVIAALLMSSCGTIPVLPDAPATVPATPGRSSEPAEPQPSTEHDSGSNGRSGLTQKPTNEIRLSGRTVTCSEYFFGSGIGCPELLYQPWQDNSTRLRGYVRKTALGWFGRPLRLLPTRDLVAGALYACRKNFSIAEFRLSVESDIGLRLHERDLNTLYASAHVGLCPTTA